MRKYHYLILFLTGFLVLWPFVLHKLYIEQKKNTEAFVAEEGEDPVWETGNGEEMEEPDMADGTVSGDDTLLENGDASETETGGDDVLSSSGEDEETAGEDSSADVERDLPPELYFQDTLFIGDSRTMGLAEYADLNNAVVFANTGMNIYRLYTLKNAVQDQEAYLEDILAKKQYRKIYLMLGINELGYDETQTVKRYEEEVLKLQESQPDAKIILEANLHVTTARSERDNIFNNAGIDRINESIRKIAEKYEFSYIDVNEMFDDEAGGLNPDYTHDEVHVLGKYYQQWADWIKETGV